MTPGLVGLVPLVRPPRKARKGRHYSGPVDRNGRATAVVVDEWPLVRLGMVHALRSLDVAIVAETAQGEEGVRRTHAEGATYLLLGTHHDLAVEESARRAKAAPSPPQVLVLVDRIGQEALASLLTTGIEGLLVRSVHPGELADAVSRVSRGERVVAPALMPLLVGVLAPAGGGERDEERGAPPGGDGLLTRKELEVLRRLAEGRSNREIAETLFVTPATVKSHLAHIYVKLGVAGRQEAVARAVALGLLR